MRAVQALAVVTLGFLLGSIPFPYLLTRRRGIDLRTVGSGNVGATNALRVSSPGTAITVLALDVTKGSLAVWLAGVLTPQPALVVCAGLAAVAGHVYPPWIGFRGGKGMATTAGVFAVLAPAAAAVSAVIFVALIAASRYVSLGSLGAMAALPPHVRAMVDDHERGRRARAGQHGGRGAEPCRERRQRGHRPE